MIIAFCGMDGAGKTTLSHQLKKELTHRGYSVAVIEPFKYVIWAPFLRLFGGGQRLSSSQGEHKNKFFLFKLWPVPALLDHWLQYLFRIKPLERKYDYVIADRFFLDFAASFSYFGYTTTLLKNLYLNLIPKADLTFSLISDPQIAQKREKGDSHSTEFFEFQRNFYRDLSRVGKSHSIDTTDTSATTVINHVLKILNG